MKTILQTALASLASLMIALASMNTAQAHDAASETIAPVMKQAIPEAPGKNVLIATVTFAPGQASEPHMHKGSVFAYVTQGHIESQIEGSPARTYGPGEAWYEPPGSRHLLARNVSATEPAQILVFAVAGEHDAIKQPIPH
ncbi:cupin domain-containing protein [Paraburkholderia tropica]|uniref:Cupin domain protein n=1 Tax=Paraburkholderia tropica TaxID=92647 RepID=A0AAQ1JVT7_9BURK|nr:quercetin dioxygenase-like cupin family protein [Paraburkholderia tropica]PZW88265.1 quercetin dioxygenase-like cupin family protein [Paraburkholderia tropica]RQM47456.1 cupin domain-containing protein [Paraburkholderia bannensis]RQN37927.1 cupin domain-containing protein [Paraburkholderia tropica]SEJ99984.1 Cupin domain protein [Paraburkholderia tropica]